MTNHVPIYLCTMPNTTHHLVGRAIADSASILLAATTEAVGARLEEASTRSADGLVSPGVLGWGVYDWDSGGSGDWGGDWLGVGTSVVWTAGIGLAAATEAVGAGLEETGAGSADSLIALHSWLVGSELVIGAPLCSTTSIRLAAATEAVGAGLEEASTGSADGLVSPGALGWGVYDWDSNWSCNWGSDWLGVGTSVVWTAGIGLAAATETVGARLEEASTGSADSLIALYGWSIASELVIGAPLCNTTSITLAATAEAVGARLKVASAGSADSLIALHSWSIASELVIGAPLCSATSIRLAAATEAVGAGLEVTGTGSADSLIGPGVLGGRSDGRSNRFGFGFSSNLDTGLVIEVVAPGLIARVGRAVATEAILSAGVVCSAARTFKASLVVYRRSSASKGGGGQDGEEES
jgi:hypothetical protein